MTIHVPLRTFDEPRTSAASLFRRAKKLERNYQSVLRKIARHVGDIAAGLHLGDDLAGSPTIVAALRRYAGAIEAWAPTVADRMVTEVAAADRVSWRRSSGLIGRLLHKEIETAPTGRVLQDSLQRQVDLITSLPLEAAERVHKLTIAGMSQGRRTSAIAADILATGDVTRSRADLIAATEVSRTATELTKARAEHIGCTHYIWRTMHDGSVRHDHKVLDGQAFRWDAPPVADSRTGARAHPGCIYRCRCYAEPVISEGPR